MNAPNFVCTYRYFAFVIIEKTIIDLVKSKCFGRRYRNIMDSSLQMFMHDITKVDNGLTIQKERAIIGMLSIYSRSPIPY